MSKIANFYNGKRIFLTGGTGFVGKGIINKLLKNCSDIDAIYLLMRPQTDAKVVERLHRTCNGKVFDNLRREQPNFIRKIKPIEGDLLKPDLGMSSRDKEELRRDVDIVIHSGGDVSYRLPTRYALDINVIGVRRMAAFCKELKSLKAYIHMSTLYSNCIQPFVEEVLYPPCVDLDIVLKERCSSEELEQRTGEAIDAFTNIYFFTKHLGEHIVNTEFIGIPVAVVRPPGIACALQEPYKGWIGNYGFWGYLLLARNAGWLKMMRSDQTEIPWVPLDVCVNTALAAGWHTATTSPETPLVYNCVASGTEPLSLDLLLKYDSRVDDSSKTGGPLLTVMESSENKNVIAAVQVIADNVNSYLPKHFRWSCKNMERLISSLNEEDKTIFDLDTSDLCWPSYIEMHYKSLRAFKNKQM